MTSKTASIVSYITIIGWLISYFTTNNQERSSLLKFHLNQSLGLFLVSVVFQIATTIIAILVPTIASILSMIGIVFLILMIVGIINANSEQEKPLPIIGNLFLNKFSFIK
jgi:uncharacterized membrane protein